MRGDLVVHAQRLEEGARRAPQPVRPHADRGRSYEQAHSLGSCQYGDLISLPIQVKRLV